MIPVYSEKTPLASRRHAFTQQIANFFNYFNAWNWTHIFRSISKRASNLQNPPNPSLAFPETRFLPPVRPAMAPGALARLLLRRAPTPRLARPFAAKARASRRLQEPELPSEEGNNFAGGEVAAPTEGISKPLAEVLKELGKRVPDPLVKTRIEDNGFAIKYIPW